MNWRVAQKRKTLQRNFQGYSTRGGADIYAFGMSSISQADGIYWQNTKNFPAMRRPGQRRDAARQRLHLDRRRQAAPPDDHAADVRLEPRFLRHVALAAG